MHFPVLPIQHALYYIYFEVFCGALPYYVRGRGEFDNIDAFYTFKIL